jgi:hypothetical protein
VLAAALTAAIALTAACASSGGSDDADPPGAFQAELHSTVIVDKDAFARSVLNGWGGADAGGDWTVGGGPASDFSVSSRVANMHLLTPGVTLTAYLYGLVARHSISQVDFTFDKSFDATSSAYLSLAARHSREAQYRLRVKVLAGGAVQISVTKTVGHKESVLATRDTTVKFVPGQFLRMRLEVTGAATATLEGKVWPVGTHQPDIPQVFVRDSIDPLPAGHGGLSVYLSAHATNAPVTASFAHFNVSELIS